MTEEKIIELVDMYHHQYLFGDCWEFEKDGLINLVQAVIKEERKRVNQIIDEVYRQGDHLRWLDCAIAIADRIEQ